MKRRRGTEKYCSICGESLNTRRKVVPHCGKPECIEGYALNYVHQRSHQEGDHLIWDGAVRYKSTASFGVSVRDERNKVAFRALDVLYKAATGEDHPGHNYLNKCGVDRCISIEHNEPQYAKTAPSQYIKAKLPAEPLLRVIDSETRAESLKGAGGTFRERIRNARNTGVISVTHVDEICIDILKCHPAEIYGMDFFEAS